MILIQMILVGQTNHFDSKFIKKLKSENSQQEGNIYISYNLNDTMGTFDVFLVNQSNHGFELIGYNGTIEFMIEAKSKNGDWLKFNPNESFFCGTGHDNFYFAIISLYMANNVL